MRCLRAPESELSTLSCSVRSSPRFPTRLPCEESSFPLLTLTNLSGGFAPKELAKRVEDAKPACILAASCGLEPKGIIDYKAFIDQALAISSHKTPVLLLRRTGIVGHVVPKLSAQKGEFDWMDERAAVLRSKRCWKQVKDCVEMDSR